MARKCKGYNMPKHTRACIAFWSALLIQSLPKAFSWLLDVVLSKVTSIDITAAHSGTVLLMLSLKYFESFEFSSIKAFCLISRNNREDTRINEDTSPCSCFVYKATLWFSLRPCSLRRMWARSYHRSLNWKTGKMHHYRLNHLVKVNDRCRVRELLETHGLCYAVQ